MTSIEIKPEVHILPATSGQPLTYRVFVTHFPSQPVTDGSFIGQVRGELAGFDEGRPYYTWRAYSPADKASDTLFDRNFAVSWLVDHFLAQNQVIELKLTVTVNREMWDLVYGEMGDAEREEDVRSYVSASLWEVQAVREGGIVDVDVDMT